MTASSADLSPRQRDILAAARTLLDREGVDGLTVAALADALGIKAPSLYKHFAGKREIEVQLIADGFAEFARALDAAGPRLTDLGRAYRAFALARPHLYRLMTDRPLPRDELPPGTEERGAAPLTTRIEDRDLARATWAFAHGMVTLELAGRFPESADLDAAWAAGLAALDYQATARSAAKKPPVGPSASSSA